MQALRAALHWLADRSGLGGAIKHLTEHPVPPETTRGKISWMYIFGMGAMVAFLLQVVTGAILATKYVPSTAHAYESIVYITEEVPLGRLLRGMHFFGASAMVVFVCLHMARVFLTGSYKFPRELNWVTGVVLFGLTMLMAFMGQLLRWDEHGVWTVTVSAFFAGRVPLIGEPLAEFILGGETIGGTTLSLFFILHVFVVPALIVAMIGLHFYLVVHHGISEAPRPGKLVDPATYRAWYARYLERYGRPYWPDAAWKEIVTGVAIVVTVAMLALIFGPRPLGSVPDPTRIEAVPMPDWFLIWYYALLFIKPRELTHFVMVYAPILVGVLLLLLPFLSNRGERSPLRRPWTVAVVGFTAIGLGMLIDLGMRAPWVPDFDTQPLTPEVLQVAEGPVFDGSQLFFDKGCQYCHMVLDEGGLYGPDLTHVARRISPEEIAVRTVDGLGRDMPAYRFELTTEELNAIVAFLVFLSEREQ